MRRVPAGCRTPAAHGRAAVYKPGECVLARMCKLGCGSSGRRTKVDRTHDHRVRVSAKSVCTPSSGIPGMLAARRPQFPQLSHTPRWDGRQRTRRCNHAGAGDARTAARYCCADPPSTRPLAQTRCALPSKTRQASYDLDADHCCMLAGAGVRGRWQNSRPLDPPHEDQDMKAKQAHASLGAAPVAAAGTALARRKKSRSNEVALPSHSDICALPTSSLRLHC